MDVWVISSPNLATFRLKALNILPSVSCGSLAEPYSQCSFYLQGQGETEHSYTMMDGFYKLAPSTGSCFMESSVFCSQHLAGTKLFVVINSICARIPDRVSKCIALTLFLFLSAACSGW